MQPLLALYRPDPSLEGALTAIAGQLVFLCLIALGFFVVARRRFHSRQIFTALGVGGLLGTSAGLAIALFAHLLDRKPWSDFIHRNLLDYFERHESLRGALFGMVASWIALELFLVSTKPLCNLNDGSREEHPLALKLTVLGLGGLVGFSLALVFFTMPSNTHSPTFWLVWLEDFRWDWWLRGRIFLSILAAPLGMLAGAVVLKCSACRRYPIQPPASAQPAETAPKSTPPE